MKLHLREKLIWLWLWAGDNKSGLIFLAGSGLLTCVINTAFTVYIFTQMPEVRTYREQKNIFSKEEKLNEARAAYKRYRTLDKRELQYSFFQIAGEWVYKLGGSNQFKEGDCIGAVDSTLEHYGAQLPRETVQKRIERLERLRQTGATYKCVSQYGPMAPKTGDLIFTQVSYNNPSHEAIVYDVQNGYIRYLEMGGVTKSANLMSVPIGSAQVYAVYAMTIEVWLGE